MDPTLREMKEVVTEQLSTPLSSNKKQFRLKQLWGWGGAGGVKVRGVGFGERIPNCSEDTIAKV